MAVLPPALLSRKCFCGPEMLRVLSAGLTPHTAHPPLGSVCTGPDRGWAAQLEQANPGGTGGVCIKAPIAHGATKPLWQPCAPLMGKPPRMVVWPCRSFKGASAGLCRSSPDSPGSTCGKAGDSAGCPLC